MTLAQIEVAQPSPSLHFEPLPVPSTATDVDFGADAGPLDIPGLSDAQFAELERAVMAHHVVVIRDQQKLSPKHQFELTRRFDPNVKTYGHGNREDIMKQSVLMQDLVSIPAQPQVKLLGNGRVKDHEGIADVQLTHPSHRTFHKAPLSNQEEGRGLTRFYRWHIDAALYALSPPKVTTLLAIEVPEPRRQTVVYDDGSGDSLDVQLGTTVFVSGAKAFEGLTPAQREWALKTKARYAPHPYVWMKHARARSTGLGLFSEGKELAPHELPEWEEEKIATLPLVWKNPLTGKLALQLHAYCVQDLIVDGQPIGNLEECRRLLYDLMRPAIAPKRIYAHPWKAGDLVIFNNRGVWHSVVGSLRPDDVRVYHQCNLASSEGVLGALD